MVGWGVGGGAGWLGKGGRLEYQRGTNHGGGGAWLTGSRVWQNEMTPLHWAAEKGHAAVVGALLKAKADKDATDDEVRGEGVQGESGAVRCGLHQFLGCSFTTELNELSENLFMT